MESGKLRTYQSPHGSPERDSLYIQKSADDKFSPTRIISSDNKSTPLLLLSKTAGSESLRL